MAIKFISDIYYSNSYYAKVGGVNLEEVNNLELSFLEYIDYKLLIETECF